MLTHSPCCPSGQLFFTLNAHPAGTRYTLSITAKIAGKMLPSGAGYYSNFSTGRRETCFLGESVVKYHRTLTDWLAPLFALQLHVNGLSEPQPSAHLLATVPGMQDELRRPMMLIISVSKPA
jgi:hypothetical protein